MSGGLHLIRIHGWLIPDHAHAISHTIALLQHSLYLHWHVKMLELRAGCWDGHTTITNVVYPLCNNGELVSTIHILECNQCWINTSFIRLRKRLKVNIKTGWALNQADTLGWLPSVIEVTDEDMFFILIHKMDNTFFDKVYNPMTLCEWKISNWCLFL